jgi:hypothetical protein
LQGGKQMTAAKRSADAPTSWKAKWKSIDWRTVRDSVKRLQVSEPARLRVRIAKAVTVVIVTTG